MKDKTGAKAGSALREAAMQRLISLTKRTVAANLARIDELLGEDSRPIKPRKQHNLEKIQQRAERQQRFNKGMHWK